MAFNFDRFTVSVTLVDNGGQVSVLTFGLVGNVYTTVQPSASTLRQRLAAVTDCALVKYSVTGHYPNDSLVLPGEVAQIENKASLNVLLAGGNKKANMKIPSPRIGIFAGSVGGAANVVNILNPALLTYIDLFTLSGNKAYISDGERVDRLLSGKRVHSGSNLG
jgi:hypothetical protein